MTAITVVVLIAAGLLAWRFLVGRVRLVGRICQDDGRLPIVSELPAAELVQDDAYPASIVRKATP